jgi:segregation and condensation protein B
MGMNAIDDLPDIAPYLPEDADVAELGAEDTEVLAEIDGALMIRRSRRTTPIRRSER